MLQLFKKKKNQKAHFAVLVCVTDFIYCRALHFFTLGVDYLLDVFEMTL